jgi:hypothetical protein
MKGLLAITRTTFVLGGLALSGLGLGGPAQAVSTSGKDKSGSHKALAMLHAAKHHLEQADHDYKGHRLKALHEVDQAIHDLGGHHHHSKMTSSSGKGGKTGKGQAKKEPQSQSDHQLKLALHELHSAEKDLTHSSGKGSKGGKGGKENGHHKAESAIHQAINELHTALKIK